MHTLYIYFLKGNCIGLEYHIILSKIHIIVIIKTKIIDKNKSCSNILISKMDPIKYIFEKPALTGRLARWQMLITEYDIQYVTQKAIKGSVLADHLAHQPL